MRKEPSLLILPDDLSPTQMNAVKTIASLAESGASEMVTQHWRRQAFRAHHVLGDFAAAVIFTETAGEVFFDSLLMSLAWEDQKWSNKTAVDQHVVEGWFRRSASFTWRLRNDRTLCNPTDGRLAYGSSGECTVRV